MPFLTSSPHKSCRGELGLQQSELRFQLRPLDDEDMGGVKRPLWTIDSDQTDRRNLGNEAVGNRIEPCLYPRLPAVSTGEPWLQSSICGSPSITMED